jgi:predicted house-cleaning noncanonical NTP pyrophosphatase (MazG superfamily)
VVRTLAAVFGDARYGARPGSVTSCRSTSTLRRSLLDKLVEEAEELRQAAPAERLEEAADVYEVLAAITTQLGVQWSDIERAASRKTSERGAFTERIWLERW